MSRAAPSREQGRISVKEQQLRNQLAYLSVVCERVQYPAILTIYGDVVASLLESNQAFDEYITHTISVLNLSKGFLDILKLGELTSITIRGVGEMMLNVFSLTDEVILTFYSIKPSEYFAVYEANDTEKDLLTVVDDIRAAVEQMVQFTPADGV